MPAIEPSTHHDSRPGETPGSAWLSAHLFLPVPSAGEAGAIPTAGDRAIVEVVAPFVNLARGRGWIRRWFFIRYQELGHHLRLRLEGDPTVLAEEVLPALLAALAAKPEAVVDEIGERHDCGAGAVSHLRFIPYEPEVERYGGPAGLTVAEDFFQVSSDAVLALVLAGGTREEAGRSGLALLAMATLGHAFCGDPTRARDLAHVYGRTGLKMLLEQPGERTGRADWERIFELRADQQPRALAERVEDWWQAMAEGVELPEPFDRYHAGLLPVAGRLRQLCEGPGVGRLAGGQGAITSYPTAVDYLAPSYLHMTSNRLGITVLEEAFLGSYLARLLDAVVQAAPADLEEAAECRR